MTDVPTTTYGTSGVHPVHQMTLAEQLALMWSEPQAPAEDNDDQKD